MRYSESSGLGHPPTPSTVVASSLPVLAVSSSPMGVPRCRRGRHKHIQHALVEFLDMDLCRFLRSDCIPRAG